ncbi:nuclear transport factor 2 family protein [Mesorhizobium sp. PAMC28654]|uniref:nuclear transport factor 2 family protein n=1 Tax=Mesorhizobium sp. PAMC28654 TaxID=2880934 RepID=UPI001D09E11D|nr:nuclear transport factor 2 family protein [Mesorhizobium sp. PAMC28654]UDL87934.1 nuclear transport factor 2 family protein [Mesorhizobium sp. PAMC28654]
MPGKSRSELIRGYFAAYKANDREIIEAVLTDDFTFTSPYDDAIDRATYFVRCWPNSKPFKSITIERICEDGDSAFVLYRCETLDGKSFRNTELHTFRGTRLCNVEVYFGAAYKDGVFITQQPSS